MRHPRFGSPRLFTALLALAATPAFVAACNGSSSSSVNPTSRVKGQSSFVSATPPGQGAGATDGVGGGAAPAAAAGTASNTATATPTRTVQETDLYRLEGTTLYYLNSYRGLLVFDVSNVDQPRFLGRSPIFGTPIDMIVSNGIATVIVGDWYGKLDNGTPFHGSIVRGLDATDPTNIKVLGDAKLGGDIQDSRVVGTVLYAVSEDYGWEYGWGGGGPVAGGVAVSNGFGGADVIVSSVDFANGQVS